MNTSASARSLFPLLRRAGCLLALSLCVACDRGSGPPPATTMPDTSPQASSDKKLFDMSPSSSTPDAPQPSAASASASAEQCSHFVDVAARRGLEFVYQTGARGESLMVETMGGGGGPLDYDCDGQIDFFLCQGGDATAAADATDQPGNALFRKLADGRFVEVSNAALPQNGFRYGQGVAVGDYDNDGFEDVYLTNVGENTLLRNMGDGTFQDVTESAGVGDSRWSSSAAFADLNDDGLLDLYVCNYVVYDPRNPIVCRNAAGEHRICHPREMTAAPDECYINQGNGQFRGEARQRGLFGEGNKALGVAVADFNNDHLPDVYVANDTTANFLFINQGEGQFEEQALLQACAVDRMGAYQASMGLGIGDYNQDGLLDIYVTHFYDESNTLYRNLGPAGFEDVTGFANLHNPTLPRLAFGTVMADFNQNGQQELFVTNGHIENYPSNTLHRMRPQLFAVQGNRFAVCSDQAGEFFQQKFVGRGVAPCDFDNDGDMDLLVIHQDDPAALLENDSQRGNWLKLLFHGRASNRRGIGCHVTLECDQQRWVQQLYGGGSYASSREPTLIFGVGQSDGPARVTIRWPSGIEQVLDEVELNQTLEIEEPRHDPPTGSAGVTDAGRRASGDLFLASHR